MMNIRHKMRKTWTHEDILILLNLWSDYEKKLRTLKRNSHIYDKLAAHLQSRGIDATSTEVHFKINNLKQKYRKDELYGVTSWRYYENVKEILQYNKNSSQNTVKQQSTSNDYPTTTSNDYSVVQTPSFQTKVHSTSSVYELSSSHSLPQTSHCTPIPQNSSSKIYQNNFSHSITGNKNHFNATTSTNRKKKTSLKKALLEEIRRGNDIAARDQEINEKLLKQTNEINLEWYRFMKDFMDRSLTILEKNCKTG